MSKDTISIEELAVEFKKVKFTGEFITDHLRFLLGRVLTIIDSSIVDPKQNKAMKDLIKGEFIDKISFVSHQVDRRDVVAPEDFDPTYIVDEDVALGLKKIN